MKTASMNLDPERRLWLPNRRTFFFFGAAAGLGALLPAPPTKILTATEAMMPFWMGNLAPRRVTQYKFEWIYRPPYLYTVEDVVREHEEMMSCSNIFDGTKPIGMPSQASGEPRE